MPIAAPAETSKSRYLFGIAAADLAVRASVIDGNLEAIDGTMRAWATEDGSTRVDDLLDVNGHPIVETRAVMGQYRFYGPPGVTTLWVDADGGPRGLLVASQAIADAATYADQAQQAALEAMGFGGTNDQILASLLLTTGSETAAALTEAVDPAVEAAVTQEGSATLAALRAGFLRMAPKPNGLDQSAALQAILDAGIALWLHEGTYRANLLVDTNAVIRGASTGTTVLKSVSGSGKDVIKGRHFDAYTGTSQTQPEAKGDHHINLSHLTIDGNKAGNSAGYGIRVWGMGYEWDHLIVRNCAQDGIWTEFAYEVSSFAGDSTVLEAQWSHITTRYNNGNGWTCRGPHDSYLTEFTTYGNGGWGFQNAFLANTYDGGIHGNNWNSFLNGLGSFDFGSVFNLGFIIASGAAGVGIGVNIRANVSSSKIGHVLAGGHDIGLVLRGASHQINGSFFNHPTEGIRIDTADTSILNFITRNCGVHVNVIGDGGGLRVTGACAGSGTMLTGMFNPSASSVNIYHSSTPIFQIPTLTPTVPGGWKPRFPQSSGALAHRNYNEKSAAYTLTAEDWLINGNATGGAFTVTLPTAAGIAGRTYVIRKRDASTNAITVATTSNQTIDGASTRTLAAQYDRLQVTSDGSSWMVT